MPVREKLATNLISCLVIIALVSTIVISWFTQSPSADAEYKIGNTKFITANSWRHIAKISQHPHYTGSEEHDNVRDYLHDELQKLGLEVEIQNTLALSSKHLVAANVSNIIAKIPATSQPANKKALALMSHYDSAKAYSLGASDAGSGVAVVLEAARTLLESDINRENDIYIIFTDAEELGLLGAHGFIDEHPLAKKIGLVLNFEARGSGGASFTLLETNQGNKRLIQSLSDAKIPYPAANSLMYSIYKMLPNDTDLTVFREEADINGVNFAFIDDHFDYHTAQDSMERLDSKSLNHQIAYISALLPYFANFDLEKLHSKKDLVYFNFANLGLFDYPFSLVLPMSILVALVFIMTAINAIKSLNLSIVSIFIALIPLFLSIGFALLIGIGGWRILTWLYPQFNDIPQGFTYSGHYIIATAILLTICATVCVYNLTINRFPLIKLAEWYIPIIATWVIINILIAIYLTGAGFFIILAIAPLAIFGNLLRYKTSPERRAITYTLFSLPSLIIITPLIPVFVIGLGLSSLAIATLMSTLLFVTLLPILFFIKGTRSIFWVCLAGASFAFVGVHSNAEYSVERQKPSSINYLYDTQSQQAMLFSYEPNLDEFTEKYFSVDDRGNHLLSGLVESRASRTANYVTPTQPLNIKASKVNANHTQENKDFKTTSITITPVRQINSIQLISSEPIQVSA
ncbi:M20/M25/M40 family metallo-hydrolase [Aliiglaciecola lipolytica]|uniref:Peptidase M28 domain-containing protein n=1 Tax=Aliiglaciecola lipolytica E3 TaxID=1127673 RepID=K6YCX4_9ALTE|nr:M20/M25/M40 family metallo-hydrolase [Aliiglaciecola lipolytica]GAC14483.1 hypothetical protein GLIP_1854 [Aliiglaciecola lipolytica E3]